MNESDNPQDDILSWLEFGCWTGVALLPFLRWLNGPSVSTDQAVVRTALVVIAATGAIMLRFVNWRRKARSEENKT